MSAVANFPKFLMDSEDLKMFVLEVMLGVTSTHCQKVGDALMLAYDTTSRHKLFTPEVNWIPIRPELTKATSFGGYSFAQFGTNAISSPVWNSPF